MTTVKTVKTAKTVMAVQFLGNNYEAVDFLIWRFADHRWRIDGKNLIARNIYTDVYTTVHPTDWIYVEVDEHQFFINTLLFMPDAEFSVKINNKEFVIVEEEDDDED